MDSGNTECSNKSRSLFLDELNHCTCLGVKARDRTMGIFRFKMSTNAGTGPYDLTSVKRFDNDRSF